MAKKKAPPGKAKDGSKCFTRTNKGGAAYVTCEGSQGDSKATKASTKPAGKGGKAKRTGGAPGKKKPAKPKPKSTIGGYSGQKVNVGTLNKGSLNLTKPKPKPKAKAKPRQRKPKETEEQKRVRMTKQYTEEFATIGLDKLKEYLERSETRREPHDLIAIPVLKKQIAKLEKAVSDFWAPSSANAAMSAFASRSTEVASAISKEDLMDVMSIIGARNKQRLEEQKGSFEEILDRYSFPQLKTAFRKFYADGGVEGFGGVTIPNWYDKEKLIARMKLKGFRLENLPSEKKKDKFRTSAAEKSDLKQRWRKFWDYEIEGQIIGSGRYYSLPTSVINKFFKKKSDVELDGMFPAGFHKIYNHIYHGEFGGMSADAWK